MGMGNSESVHNAHEYRLHNAPVKLPMPDQKELNARFDKVLVSGHFFRDVGKFLVTSAQIKNHTMSEKPDVGRLDIDIKIYSHRELNV